ncbi:tetraacyldisaccharide 4'-kinase [Pseudoalteromonas rubra]|uniref:Tetraacyldisaccharide 4'-kinase n=1 Tax=Pseudoalteromonas rubra TaxID=43658 RepID=A0A5S3WP80_9GAMM|nr:tetraacyldisaccharide 4'-kinase [Pseudoalteromonas rubra]TMP29138.1 tetraacyldisaccharide 4'-kinase [Pseudoalteromonas rubra]TMP33497.1 tetraacyldisaccharide 4'-kinase [Pseudoalteromonas rubra]
MNRLERSWYQPLGLLNILLLPLSGLFWLLSSLRRGLFKLGLKRVYKAPVPVIIVGNIGIGGNGKTPFVLWLVPYLESLGLKVAVISRGYGAKPPSLPYRVADNSCAVEAGDEPLLIYKRLGCPVMIGGDRQASIEMLMREDKPDIIVSDDGLQHYQLARDIEICIVDAQRRFGNGLLLPAGPLRETSGRLKHTDLVVYNGESDGVGYELARSGYFSVKDNQAVAQTAGQGVAVSAIGNPQRFEQSLRSDGIELTATLHFADHHAYSAADFATCEDQAVFMTEKDAVKCQSFGKENWYYLKVEAQPSAALTQQLNSLLKQKGIVNHGL